MFTFLPNGYKEEIMREYRKRVVVVFLSLCIILATLSLALVMPTFLSLYFERAETFVDQAEAERMQDASENTSIIANISRLDARLSAIEKISAERTIISFFERVMVQAGNGISINSLTVMRDEKNGTIRVEGIASTRESLVNFSRSLQGEPSFASVDLPVSSLAKNRDIPFSIGIGLKK